MKIELNNEIDVDGQLEVFHEVYEAKLTSKGEFSYLVYHNHEDEKVVIKFNQHELVMTRFATPNTIMRFVADDQALATIPSPMGLQKLVTRTNRFELAANQLRLGYDLLPHAEADSPFASYHMTIRWFEEKESHD